MLCFCYCVCDFTLTEIEGGAQYLAHVMHGTPEQMKTHKEMGFDEGWNTTITQLEALLKQKAA